MDGEFKTLGDCVELTRGTTYDSAAIGKPGPVLLGLATIAPEGGFRQDSWRTYGGPSSNKILLLPGDIYVSLKDVTQSGNLLGSVARVPNNIESGRLTQDTVKISAKPDCPPLGYIYWLLRTPEYRVHCREHATGTTNLGLPRSDFLSFPVPAETAERRFIWTLLESIEEKIALNRQMAETLAMVARAIFKSWFVEFSSKCVVADEPAAERSDSSLNVSGLNNDYLPKGWALGCINDLAKLNPESWTSSNRPTEVRYVDLANTKWGQIEEVQILSQSEVPSRAQRVLHHGDTIVGTVRPGNGAYALIDQEGLTGSTGFAVLRPTRLSDAAFVYLTVTDQGNIETLASLADGAAYPAVRPSVVAQTPTVLPTRECLDAFSAVVTPILGRVSDLRTQSATLASLRDLFLAKLITGEVRIHDSDAQVAAA